MNVVVCTVARNENDYINEWCHYYINLGFSHIYIYDNNKTDDPLVDNFISEDIKDKVTIIKDYQNQERQMLQVTMYNDFLEKYNDTFDWCAFFDVDEFLTGIDNINTFLTQEKFSDPDARQMVFKWKLFGDDNVIERDITQPVYGFFKQESDMGKFFNNQIKCMIKGREKLKFYDAHFAINNDLHYVDKYLLTYLPSGKKLLINTYKIETEEYANETVFLYHYRTKTLSEFINTKLQRGDMVYSGVKFGIEYFWKQNEVTPEKKAWLQEHYPELVESSHNINLNYIRKKSNE